MILLLEFNSLCIAFILTMYCHENPKNQQTTIKTCPKHNEKKVYQNHYVKDQNIF